MTFQECRAAAPAKTAMQIDALESLDKGKEFLELTQIEIQNLVRNWKDRREETLVEMQKKKKN